MLDVWAGSDLLDARTKVRSPPGAAFCLVVRCSALVRQSGAAEKWTIRLTMGSVLRSYRRDSQRMPESPRQLVQPHGTEYCEHDQSHDQPRSSPCGRAPLKRLLENAPLPDSQSPLTSPCESWPHTVKYGRQDDP